MKMLLEGDKAFLFMFFSTGDYAYILKASKAWVFMHCTHTKKMLCYWAMSLVSEKIMNKDKRLSIILKIYLN